MGHGEHGGAQPAEQLPQFDHQAFPERAVELAERLVQHQQPGPGRERPGERDTLLLAAGQGGHGPPGGPRQPDQLQQLPHLGVPFTPGHAVHPQPEGHVRADVPLREELVVLEHQADTAPVRGHARLVAAVEQHPSTGQGLQPGDRPQQGRLAAAAGPEHAHHLVLGDVESDRVQHGPPAEAHGRGIEAQQHPELPGPACSI